MKFENQFLSYDEYNLLGGKMDLMPFNLLEYEAERIINGRTQNRLLKVEEIPMPVKMCVNKIIDTIGNYIVDYQGSSKNETQGGSGNIASENIDGYSVSYVTTEQILTSVQEIIKSKEAELEDIMFNYLINCVVNGEHLMYLGAS